MNVYFLVGGMIQSEFLFLNNCYFRTTVKICMLSPALTKFTSTVSFSCKYLAYEENAIFFCITGRKRVRHGIWK